MRVNLIKLYEPLTPERFFFDEPEVRKAIARTEFPIISMTKVQAHENPFDGNMFDRPVRTIIEFRCTGMDVVDGYLVGDLEFSITPCRPTTHPEKYHFFARVFPINSKQMSVSNRVFTDFFFSSVDFREIA